MSDTNANNTTPAGKPLPSSVPPGYRGNTPLMLQYFATREENPGVILLMRVGDFFEAYGDDAETIAINRIQQHHEASAMLASDLI